MTSQSLPSKVVLHLGAHKTASTHLQQAITAALPLEGVRFIGPRALRDPGCTLPERFGFPLDGENTQVGPVCVHQTLVTLSNGADRLVFSDENFAGKLKRGWGQIPRPLYFTASGRLAQLTDRITKTGGPRVDLCLGIRNPADYLGSAYSQILLGNRALLPEKFKLKNPVPIVDWADYVKRLRGCPGVGTVTIWRQEDYAAVFDQICMAMVGTSRISPLVDYMQPRLSEQAVDAILMAKDWTGPEFKREAAQALPVSPDNPAFDLYDAHTHAQSQTAYAQQCATIAAMPDVTFLQQ